MYKYVYISYSKKDEDASKKLKDCLQMRFNIPMLHSSKAILNSLGGASISPRDALISSASCVLMLLSKNAFLDRDVKDDLKTCTTLKKSVICCKISAGAIPAHFSALKRKKYKFYLKSLADHACLNDLSCAILLYTGNQRTCIIEYCYSIIKNYINQPNTLLLNEIYCLAKTMAQMSCYKNDCRLSLALDTFVREFDLIVSEFACLNSTNLFCAGQNIFSPDLSSLFYAMNELAATLQCRIPVLAHSLKGVPVKHKSVKKRYDDLHNNLVSTLK